MNTSRRQILATGALAALGWAVRPRTALGAVAVNGCEREGPFGPLVTIFLRGGADGLNVVVPYGDDGYYQARPTLALGSPHASDGVVDLDGFFGLHPALSPIAPLFEKGEMAIVHACGSGDQTRSHFEAMATVERGTFRDTGPASGWLARHLDSAPWEARSPLRAVAMGEILPDSLRGATRATALRTVADYQLDDQNTGRRHWREDTLAALYGAGPLKPDLLGESGVETVAVLRKLQSLAAASGGASPTAGYPADDLGLGLSQVACLIKSGIGLEAACLDHQGYDTHVAQGGADGWLSGRLGSLAGGLSAFVRDLGPQRWTNTTVVVLTEFGRRVAENDGAGTDHGRAGILFVLGGRTGRGQIIGGRVHGRWPGLSPAILEGPGDLPVTTDYRDVLAEVLANRIGNPHTAAVFPGLAARPVGVVHA